MSVTGLGTPSLIVSPKPRPHHDFFEPHELPRLHPGKPYLPSLQRVVVFFEIDKQLDHFFLSGVHRLMLHIGCDLKKCIRAIGLASHKLPITSNCPIFDPLILHRAPK
jgi:hypothetical protein